MIKFKLLMTESKTYLWSTKGAIILKMASLHLLSTTNSLYSFGELASANRITSETKIYDSMSESGSPLFLSNSESEPSLLDAWIASFKSVSNFCWIPLLLALIAATYRVTKRLNKDKSFTYFLTYTNWFLLKFFHLLRLRSFPFGISLLFSSISIYIILFDWRHNLIFQFTIIFN